MNKPNKPNKPQRYAVLTFDDGFRDFYTYAYPILKKYSFTATVFLPTGFIGNGQSIFNGKEHLRWDEVREIRFNGIEFGSHTVSHPKLRNLKRKNVENELSYLVMQKAQVIKKFVSCDRICQSPVL
ncbi:polysaccharide deacetylase family protein [bacterium]|nr:polysaccharide deacetylase family protein [bacterium]